MKFLTIVSMGVMTITGVVAQQNCGPSYGHQFCAPGFCCSQHGWCGTSAEHCDLSTCQKNYSGGGSACADPPPNPGGREQPGPPPTLMYSDTIPVIDTCGGSSGVSCPGVGPGGWFYRCCSANGQCGPKINIQNQADYCGSGCQPGFGACDSRQVPPPPTSGTTVSTDGTCGPIVNKRCPSGQCCSGSNYCGTTEDFCGAANWCQPSWGRCN